MFKVIKDGGFRCKARSLNVRSSLKYFGIQRRSLATSEDLVSSADVVIVGKYGVFICYSIANYIV